MSIFLTCSAREPLQYNNAVFLQTGRSSCHETNSCQSSEMNWPKPPRIIAGICVIFFLTACDCRDSIGGPRSSSLAVYLTQIMQLPGWELVAHVVLSFDVQCIAFWGEGEGQKSLYTPLGAPLRDARHWSSRGLPREGRSRPDDSTFQNWVNTGLK